MSHLAKRQKLDNDTHKPTGDQTTNDASESLPSPPPANGSHSPIKCSNELAVNAAVAGWTADLYTPGKYPFKINPPPVGRAVRVYCDGIYDVFHVGHAKSLEQAKKSFPNVYLLVGVCDDATTHARKGKTVLTEDERVESVRHCRWVDEVIPNAPWIIGEEFLEKHQIDFVAHDDIPYASGDQDDIYRFVKAQGKFLPTKRTEGISTSDLITRIVKDYDQYVRRNLERGFTPKELNIGFLKEQELNVKKSLSDIQQNWHGVKEDLSGLRSDVKQTFAVWEERSQEFVRGFAGLFGADSVLDKLLGRLSPRRPIQDGNVSSGGNSSEDSQPTSPIYDQDSMEQRSWRSRKSPVKHVISLWRRDSSPS
ncbi:495_t:CDS:2 [Paraglomus occultum]|uniref:choline-phosphate cytidylyltransferase n=1 Tax=Paraglomus occultum TaxID=144539 RepID=A0A9N9BF64_9GLOM|nr:495_t:CDS:2 [Paraglomus occultum]